MNIHIPILVLGWQYLTLDLLDFGVLRYFHRNWPGTLAAGAEFLSPSRQPPLTIRDSIRGSRHAFYSFAVGNRLGLATAIREYATISKFPHPRILVHILASTITLALGEPCGYIRRHLAFCIPSSRQAQKFTNLFLVFSFSGFLHVMSAVYAGVSDSSGAVFLFFVTVPFIITMEDICRTQVRRASYSGPTSFLGLLWGLAWLYVCLPWFAYAALRLPVQTNAVIPFSFVEEFGVQAAMGVVASGGILWNSFGGQDPSIVSLSKAPK